MNGERWSTIRPWGGRDLQWLRGMHIGYSGSAPLLVAPEGNPMQEMLGGLSPVTQTALATFNLVTSERGRNLSHFSFELVGKPIFMGIARTTGRRLYHAAASLAQRHLSAPSPCLWNHNMMILVPLLRAWRIVTQVNKSCAT